MIPKIVVTPNYFPSTWCNNVNAWMINNVPIDPSFGKTGVRRCDVRFLSANMKPYEGVFKSLIDYTKSNIN